VTNAQRSPLTKTFPGRGGQRGLVVNRTIGSIGSFRKRKQKAALRGIRRLSILSRFLHSEKVWRKAEKTKNFVGGTLYNSLGGNELHAQQGDPDSSTK